MFGLTAIQVMQLLTMATCAFFCGVSGSLLGQVRRKKAELPAICSDEHEVKFECIMAMIKIQDLHLRYLMSWVGLIVSFLLYLALLVIEEII